MSPKQTSGAFAALGVPPPLSAALKAMRVDEPFEIQRLAIPDAIAGRDIAGKAPTGSGKTLAFGLPMLTRLKVSVPGSPTGLILAPTRELAEQIRRELEPLARSVKRRTLAVYGGKALPQQRAALAKRVDLLVACPGRLLDLIDQGVVNLGSVQVVVVDEADRMADMGFLPDVQKLLDQTPDDRQTILYSATLDSEVQVLIDKYQKDPCEHAVADVEPDLSLLINRFIEVPKRGRAPVVADLITDAGTSIVFVRTRRGVDRLTERLKRLGVKAAYIHGGRSQSQRDRALDLFTAGKVQALVATDVAARGIHIDDIRCVIHYDPPADHKDYVHRSGRTARAGASGTVVSLLDTSQLSESKKLRRQLQIDAKIEPTPERKHFLEPVATTEPKTKPKRQTKGSKDPGHSKSGAESTQKNGAKKNAAKKSSAKKNGANKSNQQRQHRSNRKANSERKDRAAGVETLRSRRSRNKTSERSKTIGAASDNPETNHDDEQPTHGRRRSQPKKAGHNAGRKSGHTARRKSRSKAARPGSSRSKKAGSGTKPKSKRSGKPRPKNRKQSRAAKSQTRR